jgi:outer membrane immunogenic protein
MKRLLLAAVAITFAIGSASAADMPVKAPIAPPVYQWTGIYFGGDDGWQGQRHSWAYDPPVAGAANQSWTERSGAATLGVFVGAQVQWGSIVLGAEASANSDVLNTAWDNHTCPNTLLNCRTRATDIVTAGGRLGYAGHTSAAYMKEWLLYASGGWAKGTVETKVEVIATGLPTNEITHAWQGGWYAGGGVETVIFSGGGGDVIGGVDYKHIDLGTQFQCVVNPTCVMPSVLNRDVGARVDMVTARVMVKVKP